MGHWKAVEIWQDFWNQNENQKTLLNFDYVDDDDDDGASMSMIMDFDKLD